MHLPYTAPYPRLVYRKQLETLRRTSIAHFAVAVANFSIGLVRTDIIHEEFQSSDTRQPNQRRRDRARFFPGLAVLGQDSRIPIDMPSINSARRDFTSSFDLCARSSLSCNDTSLLCSS
jgi:hypothetical protein